MEICDQNGGAVKVIACIEDTVASTHEYYFPTIPLDEWHGVPNSTDESVYSSLQGFAESDLPETFVMEEHAVSLNKFPPIAAGSLEPYTPAEIVKRAGNQCREMTQTSEIVDG